MTSAGTTAIGEATTETIDAPRLLCVDDEPRVLEALARTLHGRFTVVTAVGATQALEALGEGEGFAVVMSDLRMPGMDGIALLARVRELAPDAVRVLLTGHADLEIAIDAVNHGHVFRFLRKPCHPDILTRALRAAVAQHRLVTAERELLERTLRGSVRALAEVLALVSPAAFGRAERVQRIVGRLAGSLAVPDVWSIEVAATVWHLGCVALSPALADRVGSGLVLSADEEILIRQLPEAAARLVAHVPRLELVGELLHAAAAAPSSAVPVGAQILRAALELDTLDSRGLSATAAFEVLDVALAGYDSTVLAELRQLRGVEGASATVREMRLRNVVRGMVFADDVINDAGLLLIARGQAVTVPLIERIRSSWSSFAATRKVRMITRTSALCSPDGDDDAIAEAAPADTATAMLADESTPPPPLGPGRGMGAWLRRLR